MLAEASAVRDMRIWVVDRSKMSIDEFVDSFNQGIADNMLHSFDFPGKVLLDKYPVEVFEASIISSKQSKNQSTTILNSLYIDEVIFNEREILKNKDLILFLEAR